MYFKKWISGSFVLLVYIVHVGESLYEDQIGKFDWKQSFVGNIKFGRFDSVKRIVVATEENTLASLHLKNGQIAWRQVLESPASNSIVLLHVDQEVITVSGDDTTWYVRGWDIAHGFMLWEWTVNYENNENLHWVYAKNQIISIFATENSHLEVTGYDTRTGRVKGKAYKVSTTWMNDVSKCVAVNVYWACISNNLKLYYVDITSDRNEVFEQKVSLIGNLTGQLTIKSLEDSSSNVFLSTSGHSRLINLKPIQPIIYKNSFSSNPVTTTVEQNNIAFYFTYDSEKVQLKNLNLETDNEEIVEVDYKINAKEFNILNAVCRGSACRILFRASDNSLSLLQLPSGKIMWTREESLSNVVAAEFLELPLSELDASIEHEFDGDSSIFGLLFNRLTSQAKQLSVFINGQPGDSSNKLVRDEFGLHKVIVIVTQVGKVFGLDSLTGQIIWSRFFNDVKPYILLNNGNVPLFIQRTVRYSPLSPQCTILLRDKQTSKGIIFSFDPITGQKQKLEYLSYRIQQAMLLPDEDDNHLKGLVVLSSDNQVYLYPSSAKSILRKHAHSTFIYTVNSADSLLRGYNFINSDDKEIKLTHTWTVNLGPAEIQTISIRPSFERVHSQGRVLADRSVLYKYVNPNLLAIATLAGDPIQKRVLSIYLIDGITGLVVYSTIHKRANKPVHLVHSENWLVYSYFNERFRRIEVVSVEFYEGAVQSNSTAFSSHAISQLPHPETQAYIFPATPVAIQTTITERGITNKHILVALTNGAVMEVPWAFLEPRNMQGLINPEEGYIPYMPELPVPSENTINYNQSLARVKNLVVAPARLESTCLVLVYGLDLYYTRVTPSKTFDLLKEDFDHWLIAVVLFALITASYVVKHLASRKALKQAWK